jgi:hypothetical protein
MNLPSLRADLQLSPAAPALDGSPRWTLADPVRGRYFKLGAAAMRLLRHWSLGDPEQALRAANREPGLPLDGVELEQLLTFLRGHDLISALDDQQRASYSLKASRNGRACGKSCFTNICSFAFRCGARTLFSTAPGRGWSASDRDCCASVCR